MKRLLIITLCLLPLVGIAQTWKYPVLPPKVYSSGNVGLCSTSKWQTLGVRGSEAAVSTGCVGSVERINDIVTLRCDGSTLRKVTVTNSFVQFNTNWTMCVVFYMSMPRPVYNSLLIGQAYPNYSTPDPNMRGGTIHLINANPPQLASRNYYSGGSAFIVASLQPQTNTWNCAALVMRAGLDHSLFLNGTNVGSSPNNNLWMTNIVCIGSDPSLGLAHYNGLIGEWFIDDRAWSPKELRDFWQQAKLNYTP